MRVNIHYHFNNFIRRCIYSFSKQNSTWMKVKTRNSDWNTYTRSSRQTIEIICRTIKMLKRKVSFCLRIPLDEFAFRRRGGEPMNRSNETIPRPTSRFEYFFKYVDVFSNTYNNAKTLDSEKKKKKSREKETKIRNTC